MSADTPCITSRTGHCWHTQSVSRRTWGGNVTEEHLLRCCACGGYTNEKWATVPDPEHGPFAPQLLRKVSA